jgi:lipoate-protein ligase A
MLFYRSGSNDPYFNLALEEHIFGVYGGGAEIFMLWQNDNTIVIGKNQNAAAEINSEYVESNNIKVARRLSGGGAVYHDMGNLNFTFIVPDNGSSELDFGLFCAPVAKTLEGMGITAEFSGRNDITIDGKKFSGNAQYRKNGLVMHHGTIMFSSDLTKVTAALNVSGGKLESKGVKSVRSRVTNICDYLKSGMTLGEFEQALIKNVLPDKVEYLSLTDADIARVNSLRDSKYSLWEWNFGRSPKYSVRKQQRVEGCGNVEIYLEVNRGVIEGIECFGDYFEGKGFDGIASLLKGCRADRASVMSALGGTDVGGCIHNLSAEKLAEIICK